MNPVTVGLIVGNRGFFPSYLCEQGREEMIQTLEGAGFKVIVLDANETVSGSVESLEEAHKYADFFDERRKEIDGIIVTLPNFGDERAVANTLRWAGLDVPVLIHAFPDVADAMTLSDRRDSFCGKMSVCNNLKQYGIPFTLTSLHTVAPSSPSFQQDLANFAATCRITSSLKNLRVGALGARPPAFNTVRYSEKMLENAGISVETLDLFELFGWINAMSDDDAAVQAKLAEIHDYIATEDAPSASLMKMAKFGTAIDNWMAANELQATAVQCWTALEEFFGIVPCAIMSMMSNKLMPSACEVDIMGTVAMWVLAQASQIPSAIVDWNNNYGEDPDKAVVFHCSNLPKDIFKSEGDGSPTVKYQEIIAGTVGMENAYGAVYGRIAPKDFTYLRVSTDDDNGVMRAYVGEGEFTDDPLLTFGGYGVVKIPEFQKLLTYICDNGYEHHVTVNPSRTAAAVFEALTKYKGWDVYRHS